MQELRLKSISDSQSSHKDRGLWVEFTQLRFLDCISDNVAVTSGRALVGKRRRRGIVPLHCRRYAAVLPLLRALLRVMWGSHEHRAPAKGCQRTLGWAEGGLGDRRSCFYQALDGERLERNARGHSLMKTADVSGKTTQPR